MKDNKIFWGLNLFFSGLGLIVFLAVLFMFLTNATGLGTLLNVWGYIKVESLYPADNQKMIEGATAGIVGALNDPYSKYLNKEQWEELQLQLEAEFGGIGVYVVEMEEGKLAIVSPIKGTPAARAGLQHGDIILKINGQNAVNMSQDDAVHLMRGDPGTQLELGIFRESDGQEHTFRIIREIINVPSVEDKIVNEDPTIGYIRLYQFHSRSAGELADSLNKLEKQGIKALILDLRDNGGGDFGTSIAIADVFLDKEQEVVSVKDARGKETIHQASEGSYQSPLVVLVNKNSASASEILAGALQDNGRAVLVGEKTFGKGLVQTVYPLRNGGALKLTTQKYFTPQGTDINEIGISPDYTVKEDGKEQGDRQLERAIELLQTKIQ